MNLDERLMVIVEELSKTYSCTDCGWFVDNDITEQYITAIKRAILEHGPIPLENPTTQWGKGCAVGDKHWRRLLGCEIQGEKEGER